MCGIEGVKTSRYFLAPALLFGTSVRMGKKPVMFSDCKSNNSQYNFHSYFYLQSMNLGGKLYYLWLS